MTVADAPVRQPAFAGAVGLFAATVRKHARACVVLALPYAVLVGLAGGLSKAVTLDVGPSALAVSEVAVTGIAIFVSLAVFVVLNVIVYPLTLGGLAMIGSAEVYGDAIDTDGIRRQVFDRALDGVGAFLLTALILAAAPVAAGLLAVIVMAITSPLTGFAVLVFALAVLVVPEVYVAVRLSVAVPVVIREGLKPKAALRRSWDLLHGTRWVWVFGVYLVAAVATAVAVFVLGLISGAVHVTGVVRFALDTIVVAVEILVAVIAAGAATGVVYGSVASEAVHAPPDVTADEVVPHDLIAKDVMPPDVRAHEVLPGELPPPSAF